MKVSRMDLDDTGSPDGLVLKILQAEPNLPIPVPIEELARSLDIIRIEELTTQGFEGGLITDVAKSEGVILVNAAAHPRRRRFTIAHELGHFLIPTHVVPAEGRFLCSANDLRLQTIKEQDRRARMEVEANRFAARILMPKPALMLELERRKEPDLQHIPQLARHFDVSKEPAARAYAEFNEMPIAILVTKDGRVLRGYKSFKFPKLAQPFGQSIPKGSIYFRNKFQLSIASDVEETGAEHWLETRWDVPTPTLYEQFYPQQDGYGLLLLWVEEQADEADEDADCDRTSAQRLKSRLYGRSY
jgi:Zn-dependent peptidase ImmA (M78 family)